MFSARPLPWHALQAVNLDLELAVDKAIVRKVELHELVVPVTLNDGHLVLKPSARVAGGAMSADLAVDARAGSAPAESAKVTLGLDAKDMAVGELSKAIRGVEVTRGGKMRIEARLEGSGSSVRQIMASLNGSAVSSAGGMTIQNTMLDRAGGDLLIQVLSFATPSSDAEAETTIECAVVRLPIENGLATVDRTIAMETTKILLSAAGTVDFRDEQLNLGANIKAREGIRLGAGQLASVVRLKGSFTDPTIGADAAGVATAAAATAATAGAAVMTGGLSLLAQGALSEFTVDAHPCQTALGRKVAHTTRRASDSGAAAPRAEEEGSAPDQAGEQPAEPKSGGLEKGLDELGNKLKGLFGN